MANQQWTHCQRRGMLRCPKNGKPKCSPLREHLTKSTSQMERLSESTSQRSTTQDVPVQSKNKNRSRSESNSQRSTSQSSTSRSLLLAALVRLLLGCRHEQHAETNA